MKSRFCFLATVLCVLLSFPALAAQEKKADSGEFVQPANQVLYKQLRIALDSISDTAGGLGLRLNDVRISPIIRSEEWLEYPLELSVTCSEKNLPGFLRKVLGFGFADGKLDGGAITLSVLAERAPDHSPLLFATINSRLMVGRIEGSRKSIDAHNAALVNAFTSLFNRTTMTPQIRRKSEDPALQPLGGRCWLTNVRIDNDQRVQITGYALDAKDVTAFGDELYKCGSFDEVSICNYNRNTYEKVPVYRFDIVAKISAAGAR